MLYREFDGLRVTPYTGVWIEIQYQGWDLTPIESLPIRECGLKSSFNDIIFAGTASLPIRECGLKLANLLTMIIT